MPAQNTRPGDIVEDLESRVPFQELIFMILLVMAGVLFALNLVPLWLPGLSASTAGSAPKVYWFLSRGSAIAAYWLLWLSMAMGIMITNKMAQIWPGIPPAYEIHQYTSLLGLCIALFHALILMGDSYIKYKLVEVLLPFASAGYRPTWVGFGQLAFYAWAAVNLSFYVRKQIGKKAWRLVHLISYLSFFAVMVHGIFSGTDTGAGWAQYLYWLSGASLLFLTVYRIVAVRLAPPVQAKKAARPPAPTS